MHRRNASSTLIPLALMSALVLGVGAPGAVARADTAPGAPSAMASGATGATSGGAPAAPASAAPSASADPHAADDDDGDVTKDDKPAHREKRRSYIRHMKKVLTEAVTAGGKALTDDERAAIRAHWRITMRLWRIRGLAEADGNKEAVARVDALLARADERTLAQLKDLNAKAPPATAGSMGGR